MTANEHRPALTEARSRLQGDDTHCVLKSQEPTSRIDYLAIGSDDDCFLTPLTPLTAQAIADRLDCVLPTPKMVDDIYANATMKLTPAPIPPSPAMTTVAVFARHNEIVSAERGQRPPGTLVAGHKKDVVIANRVFAMRGKVAIYGWHKLDGKPIQPLYTGHTASWVDYSHGIRLVSRRMTVDGVATTIDAVLADPKRAPLLSNEGVMLRTRYQPADVAHVLKAAPGAKFEVIHLDAGVRVVIDRPEADSGKPVLLVFYALPKATPSSKRLARRSSPVTTGISTSSISGPRLRFFGKGSQIANLSSHTWKTT